MSKMILRFLPYTIAKMTGSFTVRGNIRRPVQVAKLINFSGHAEFSMPKRHLQDTIKDRTHRPGA